MDATQCDLVQRALAYTNRNVEQAAKLMGISSRYLFRLFEMLKSKNLLNDSV